MLVLLMTWALLTGALAVAFALVVLVQALTPRLHSTGATIRSRPRAAAASLAG